MDQAFVADPDFAFRNASHRRRAASPIAFLPAALIFRLFPDGETVEALAAALEGSVP